MSARLTGRIGGSLKRALLRAIPTVLGIVVLNFLLLQLVPGDAADVLAGESGSATAETMAMMRRHFGLDLPLGQQLLNYLNHLAHFSLGFSPRFNMPVMDLIWSRLPNTLLLMAGALGLALVLGIACGLVMATWAHKWPDRLLTVLSLLLYSTPGFWVGLMAVVLFSVHLGWLPSDGSVTVGASLSGWDALRDRLAHALLPTLALASVFMAIYARLTRAAMLEAQTQDYVRTAVAKGLHPARIQLRHVLRNALIPVTTVAGVHLGNLLGGAVVIETVFSWPGLGRLALEAVQGRDYAVSLGVLLLSSFMVIFANLLIDLLHAWLDPRIKA
jgi:peptide/nickel transport system permease protein